ncbi:MAG: hypothetical protein QXL27_07775 [Candidatus Bathyarchaeia archaeon]
MRRLCRRRSIVLAPVKIRVEGGGFTLSRTCNLAATKNASTLGLKPNLTYSLRLKN